MEFFITFALWSFSLLAVVVGLTEFFFYILDKEDKTQEATPYQFEKDRFIEGFNEAIQHQRQQLYKMYKGKAK
jgi:hypothetical protein